METIIVFVGFIIIYLIAIIIRKINYEARKKKYEETDYFKATNTSFADVMFNKGTRGEYATYKELKDITNTGARLLYNLYIPYSNDKTTEIDMLVIHKNGLFVLESKDYGGWIFGNENYRNWTQTLSSYKGVIKNQFYNPIWQNRGHIDTLDNILRIDDMDLYQSIITFSNRCTLKEINYKSKNTYVVYRSQLEGCIKKIIENTSEYFTQEEIDNLYNQLLPYTCVDEYTKEKHIREVQEKAKYD